MYNIKERARKGLPSYGIILGITDPSIVQMCALAGFNFIRIDCEHEIYDYNTIRTMIISANFLNLPVLVRLSTLDDISRLLDFGASGVMIPSVNNRQEALNAVKLSKYGPLGARGMLGGSRYLQYGDEKLDTQKANEEVSLIIQIETKEALENLDEILAVEGIDMVATGRGDLSQSLGLVGQPNHPDVLEAEDYIIKKALEYGKIPNLLANTPERAAQLREKGVYCYSTGRDTVVLNKALKKHVGSFREA